MQADAQSQAYDDAQSLLHFRHYNDEWINLNNDVQYWSAWNSTAEDACDYFGVNCTVLQSGTPGSFRLEIGRMLGFYILSNLKDLRDLDMSNIFLGSYAKFSIQPAVFYLTGLTLSSTGRDFKEVFGGFVK